MTDKSSRGEGPASPLADPRVDPDQLRAFDAPDANPVLLIGCVHDHPASVYRARALVEALDPDVVAVELPGLAVPLFERVGREERGTGGIGGEMSAALAAGASIDARRVGIDTLGPRFASNLVRELRDRSSTRSTTRRVLGAVTNVTGHALSCRLSSALGRYGSASPVRQRAFDHEVDRATPAPVQADDERRQLTRSLSVLRALKRPVADDVVDAARERTMVANLASLRSEGSVVAVLGFDHLSGISDLLERRSGRRIEPDAEALERLWT